MKRNTLTIVFLIFLMVMNGILLFLVLQKPEQVDKPPRQFLSDRLDFNGEQLLKFEEFDQEHHQRMREIDNSARRLKELVFADLGKKRFSQQETDSIAESIGVLTKERELEVLRYFNKVEAICTSDQKRRLRQIVLQVFRRPPGKGRHPGPPPHVPAPPPRLE